MRKSIIIALLALILFAVPALSEGTAYVISNSANWEDVYSSMLYSTITGSKGYFLVSSRHSTLLLNQLSGQNKNILLVSSKKSPYIMGYKPILENIGFNVEEISVDSANLELAKKLPDTTRFIILDDSYGYNAISVAPYAAIDKAYVLFTNRRNINAVYAFLKARQVDELVLYGQLDREVKDRLTEFNPTVIFNGDRFADNIRIVDMYQEKYKAANGRIKTQVILSNGEFIEQEIMSGVEPVVFIGRGNVPDSVRTYIEKSGIEIGILIGNELIGTATYVRRQLGISVFVKFAQSARQPVGPISAVEDLDRFYLPRYIMNIDVYRVRYNRLANRVEVTYQNMVDLSAYLKGTITLRYQDGTQIVGEDKDSEFVDKSEFKTIIYTHQPDGTALEPMQGNITAEVFSIYGESKNSLEYTLRKTVNVEIADIQDNSNIQIDSVRYDKRKGQFLIEVSNIGKTDVFVNLELKDLLINDELMTYGTDGVAFLKVGERKVLPISVEMSDTDMENNPKVRIRAYFGERENSLVNVLEGDYEWSLTGLAYMTGQIIRDIAGQAIIYGPLIIIVILLVLILGMKKKCPDCGEINNLRAKKCKKCGKEI